MDLIKTLHFDHTGNVTIFLLTPRVCFCVTFTFLFFSAPCAKDLDCQTLSDGNSFAFFCGSDGNCKSVNDYCASLTGSNCELNEGHCGSNAECKENLLCGVDNFLEAHPEVECKVEASTCNGLRACKQTGTKCSF